VLLTHHPGVHFKDSIIVYSGKCFFYECIAAGETLNDKFLSKFTEEKLKIIQAVPTDQWRAKRDATMYEFRKARGSTRGEAGIKSNKRYTIDPVTD
jgi:hypothetical protein